MSSRANPKGGDEFGLVVAARFDVRHCRRDSETALRDTTCEVIVTDAGRANLASAQETCVWVHEVSPCDV